ncbi:MAG: ATP-binding protein [Rhodospirillales bacterium]|nr:ATP-binding protein [Rhodospirillales bacterium]
MTGAGIDGTLESSLVNDLREIAGAAEKIGAFCAEHGLTEQIAFEVNPAVDELLTNTISYGYDDGAEHSIDLVLRIQGDTLTVEIADDGRAFDPLQTPEPDLGAPLEERAVGGLGIYLVRKTIDGVAYRRQDERNVVTLTKNTTPDHPS